MTAKQRRPFNSALCVKMKTPKSYELWAQEAFELKGTEGLFINQYE